MKNYIVLELQTNGENTAVLTEHFTDFAMAQQRFFTILSFAVVSSVAIHSAVIMDETGFVLRNESFVHKVEP